MSRRRFDEFWQRIDPGASPAPAEVVPPEEDGLGLECRRCGCRHFYTIRTERVRGAIVRRRECRHCGERITTKERAI